MIARAERSRPESVDDRLGRDVREREVRLRNRVRAEVGEPDLDRRRRCRPRSARRPRPPAGRSRRDAPARSRAWPRRSTSTPEPQPMSTTLPRSSASSSSRQRRVVGVAAGPERAARIDHDGERVGVRPLPRRADPEAPDPHGPVELPPAILPVVADLRDRCAAEGLPDPLLSGRVRVRGDLDPAVAVDLLEPLREELEHDGARLLGPRGGDADRDALEDQRSALLSFSKKPSSRR